jgi:hypothetical protein
MVGLDNLFALVRTEISMHVFRPFADTEDFTSDLEIDTDDLSHAALSLENQLGVKLDREEYRKVNNVIELAKAFHTALLAKGAGQP